RRNRHRTCTRVNALSVGATSPKGPAARRCTRPWPSSKGSPRGGRQSMVPPSSTTWLVLPHGIARDAVPIVRVVLDTSVLVAAWKSRRGASYALLTHLRAGDFEIAVSAVAEKLAALMTEEYLRE